MEVESHHRLEDVEGSQVDGNPFELAQTVGERLPGRLGEQDRVEPVTPVPYELAHDLPRLGDEQPARRLPSCAGSAR